MGTEQSLEKTKEQNPEVLEGRDESLEFLQNRWHSPKSGRKGHLWQQGFPETTKWEGVNEMKGNQEGGGLNLGKSEYWRPLNIENHQQPLVN